MDADLMECYEEMSREELFELGQWYQQRGNAIMRHLAFSDVASLKPGASACALSCLPSPPPD